jgi:hypothetical protein
MSIKVSFSLLQLLTNIQLVLHRWGLFLKRLWHPFAFSPLQKNMFLPTRILGDFGDQAILVTCFLLHVILQLQVLDHISWNFRF